MGHREVACTKRGERLRPALEELLPSIVCRQELRLLFERYCLGASAREVSAHPYLVRKRVEATTAELLGAEVPLLGLADAREVARLTHWWPRAGEVNLRGPLLLVPLAPPAEELWQYTPWSFQFIDAEGRKAFLPCLSVRGSYWAARPIRDGSDFVIAEGIATTLSLQLAAREEGRDKVVAVASLSLGNMRPLAHNFRRRFPRSRIVLCPDVGTELAVRGIAEETHANVLFLNPEVCPT